MPEQSVRDRAQNEHRQCQHRVLYNRRGRWRPMQRLQKVTDLLLYPPQRVEQERALDGPVVRRFPEDAIDRASDGLRRNWPHERDGMFSALRWLAPLSRLKLARRPAP